MPTIELPELYDKQREAIFDPSRIACIEASTKAGKTLGCIVWQANRVLSDTMAREHWWVAPVYQQAKIAFRRVKKMLPSDEYRAISSPMVLTFRNGARWTFRSGERPDNLYGEDVADAVIDEASRLREESWHAIRSTLTATRGPVRLIGNVKGRKNFFYRLSRLAESGEPDMSYHKLTAHDAARAGVIDEQEIDEARRHLPEYVFRQLYLAEPTDDGGNPFGLDAIDACVGSTSSAKPHVWGWDLARSVDWTVGIPLDDKGRVCDGWQRFQRDWPETETAIIEQTDSPALVDSTGVGDVLIQHLQRKSRLFEGYKFTSASKQQLMEGLRAAIHARAITFPEGPIAQELREFGYEYTRTGVRYSAPQGLHDDCVCALALAVHHADFGVLKGWDEGVGDDGQTEYAWS